MSVTFGSTPLIGETPVTAVPDRGNVFTQGLRSGGLGAGAGLTALAGTTADFLGNKDIAASLYDTSKGLRARSVAAAPEIQSISQVDGLSSFGDYAAGLAGQALPALGAGLAGAVLARNPLIGATVATTPFTAGDLAVRQQEDPTIAAQSAGQRLSQAVGAGGLNALASNVVPVALGGKLMGRGVSQAGMGFGRNVMTNVGEGIVGNAAAGVIGEKINQNSLTTLNEDRDTSHDKQALYDAGAGGAVIGAPFAAAGIAGQARFGKKPAPRTDGVRVDGSAAPALGADGAPAPKPAPSLAERIKGAFKKDDTAIEADAAAKIAKGEDVIDAAALKSAPPEKQGAMLDEADASRLDQVKAWATKLAEDANLSPETRKVVDDFMANPADRTMQAGVAAAKVAKDAGDAAIRKATEFSEFVSQKFKDKGEDGIKLSEQISPKLHTAMADAIAPSLAERFPALVQNDKHMQVVTRSLRAVMADMQKTGRMDSDTVEQLHGWFGDDAPSVMASLHDKALSTTDKAATEKYFGALNRMTEDIGGSRSMESTVKSALPPEMANKATPESIRTLVKGLREHMDGKDMEGRPKTEVEFRTRDIENALQSHFGDKSKTVLKAFEKDAKRRFESEKLESAVNRYDPEEGVRDDFGEIDNDVADAHEMKLAERDIAEDAAPTKYRGSGKGKDATGLLRDPDVHEAIHGKDNKGQAKRLMEEARLENPDAMVDFVRVKDLPDDVRAKYPNAKDDEGLVVVEGTRDETQFTDAEMKSVVIDTHGKTSHAANNPSRIDTGVQGAVLDARALVKAMKRKLDYVSSDDHGNRNRTARAFMEGIAAVQDRLGRTFEIPGDTVLEPGFTYADAQKLSMRKPDPDWMKGKTDEQINKSVMREEALKELNNHELRVAGKKLKDILPRREAEFAEYVKGRKLDKASYREIRQKMVGDVRDSLFAAVRELERRTESVHKERTLEGEGRREVDPNENISRVGNNESRKVGFDGSPLSYDNMSRPNIDGSLPTGARNAIASTAQRLEVLKTTSGGDNKIAQALAKKIRDLIPRIDYMKKTDQAMFASIVADARVDPEIANSRGSVDVAGIASTVNDLIAKYPAGPAKPSAQLRKMATDLNMSANELKIKAERLNATYADKSDAVFMRALAAQLGKDARKLKGIREALGDTPAKKRSAFAERVLGEGDLAPVVKAIKESNDPAALRRAVDQLGDDYTNPRVREVIDAANERMMTLVEKNPDIAYSYQRTDPNATFTSKVGADIKGYIESVLGKSVDVEIGKLLHAGEFVSDSARLKQGLQEDVIRVSVHALDPMGTAHHEALHGFFSKLRFDNTINEATPLFKAADSAYVKQRLNALLKDHPEALTQVAASLEERAAYMYQFWASGELVLPTAPRTFLAKMKQMFLNVMGMWTNDQRAQHIMEYFDTGAWAKQRSDSVAVRLEMRRGSNEMVAEFRKLSKPLEHLADTVFATGSGRVRAAMIPALTEMVDKVYSPLQGAQDDPGYAPAARIKHSQILNDIAEKLGEYSAAHVTDALESLQRGVKGATPEERIVMRHVRKMLDETFDYMKEAGVEINDLGYKDGYFPRVWDTNVILNKEKEFRAMLEKYKASGELTGDIDLIVNKLAGSDGSELQMETLRPGMQFARERILGFITGDDAAPFLQKDMHQTLNSYVSQATRRAEWARRFGDDNDGIMALMMRAKMEGATKEDLSAASDFLRSVDGTIGDSINPKLRRAFGNMMVYQNIRLLPLMVFSSFVDPGGIIVRGGTMREAFGALKRGFSEIPAGLKDKTSTDEWTKLATDMGVIESAVLMKALGTSYSQGMTSNIGRKVNDTFFKYNLMARFNVSMRVGATEAAVNFLGRHADGSGTHSTRWLAELGLRPNEVVVKNGRPLLTADEFKAAGYNEATAAKMADRMTFAVNKWVDGAILRPNAAHKPVWMSDPHFALVSHLKQFVYAFQETILKRVVNEARHGNVGPAYALAAYVPFMIAADLMKGMIVGGGSQPDHKKNWDFEDYVWSGVQRAGLLGVAQTGVDVARDVRQGGAGLGAVVGPTVEQLGDAASVVGGPQQFKTFALNALPANQLLDAAGEAVSTNAEN